MGSCPLILLLGFYVFPKFSPYTLYHLQVTLQCHPFSLIRQTGCNKLNALEEIIENIIHINGFHPITNRDKPNEFFLSGLLETRPNREDYSGSLQGAMSSFLDLYCPSISAIVLHLHWFPGRITSPYTAISIMSSSLSAFMTNNIY